MSASSMDKVNTEKKYRPNVAALLLNNDDKVLIAERIRHANSWQFPQGGIDRGETPDEALFRELREEIGTPPHLVHVLDRKEGYRYEFPASMRRFGSNIGQEQTYFLCRFLGSDRDINLRTRHPEFRSFQWIDPRDFELEWLPEFKHGVYRAVLKDFFGVEFP
ncbi:RNA pyrophosphohydrolase [Sulfuriroseicoccus oceanibius]|uniref:RNA pyrophosphohydrolase n=1 Tax=Sulfuriroseicoccus oceanibius TaxID=2707525 RepID=A0A6B3LDV4_9BACT|nr:RNA pyrophosphohydrolase [Sulfuriroseicoccus oceanibius]QQL44438.1 RNA pyrophosphohydrolase [Sulfuriroseicoccus oceanibius]